ncbi:MAG: hypothetical protein HOC71_05035 [Candidatus Latescibacteria bacterium]|jgi:uncharacterized protein involved in exopolysaccharide biosynthesis|nr:hypothetical protein [Candidatus Latescibacterota bacterium]
MNEKNHIQSYEDDDAFEFNIAEWIAFFWINKFTFFKFMSVAFVIGVIVALVLPEKYTAVATILPPQTTNKSGMLSQISQIVGDFSVGGVEINELYPEIASSRIVLSEVLNATYNGKTYLNTFIDKYDIDTDKGSTIVKENILKLIRDNIIQTNVDLRTSLVTLIITANDPNLAASFANEILNQIDKYLRYNLKNTASGQAEMINSRLESVSDSLKTAEDKLLSFKESNRTINLSPNLQLTEMRLLREVEVNSTVYIELVKQIEVVKIQENQLRPVLNILDKATPPIRRSAPKRKIIVMVFMIFGFMLAFLYTKGLPAIKNIVIVSQNEKR